MEDKKAMNDEVALFKQQLELVRISSKKEFIDKLENFFLGLNQGFGFVAKNKRVNLLTKYFYVDLVFYNRLLKCFVLVNYRKGNLDQQDVEKMNLIIDYYNNQRLPDDNQTVGIVIGKLKNDIVVEYILPKDETENLVVIDETVLPNKEKLKALLIKN
ncbi:MAG: PDDEXK nuclease domain-containing protein [Saprospiraceae bacterium]